MNESLEQMALRIAKDVDHEFAEREREADKNPNPHYAWDDEWLKEFARRLLAEQQKQEPVAFATNGYGKISLYWREGLAIDFIPNGTTIGLYLAAPPAQEPRFPHCEICGSSAWFCTVCAGQQKQKQEPVAWWRYEGDSADRFAKGWFQREKPESNGIPLYAAPVAKAHEDSTPATYEEFMDAEFGPENVIAPPAQDAQDAERYRWLRNDESKFGWQGKNGMTAEQIDVAIDAAMKEPTK